MLIFILHTYTLTYMQTFSHTHTLTHLHRLTFAHTHTHTYTLTYLHTLTCTHSHLHTHSFSHSHTHNTHTHTHTHTHIHITVLLKITIAMIKLHNQKQVKEQRLDLAYASTPTSIIEGSQSRNSNRARNWSQEFMQSPHKGAAYWLCSLWFAQTAFLWNPGPAA